MATTSTNVYWSAGVAVSPYSPMTLYGEPVTLGEVQRWRKEELERDRMGTLDPPHECDVIQRLSELYRTVK